MTKNIVFYFLLVLLLTTGCTQQQVETPASTIITNTSTTPTSTQTISASPLTEEPKPLPTPVISYGKYDVINAEVTGPEEIVFDWTTDKCEMEDIPDLPARAFRDADDKVQLIATHYIGRRMIGDTLNSVKHDCTVVLHSHKDADPAKYNDCEWLASPYTFDGSTIYALVHNEYHGWEHPGMSKSGNVLVDVYTSITLAKSFDGGKSYIHDIAPNHLIATLPYQYMPDIGPADIGMPSNIVHNPKDDYFYALIFVQPGNNRSEYSEYISMMRTKTLDDPKSWRAWDGEGFNIEFIDPYASTIEEPSKHMPQRILDTNIGGSSLSFNTYLNKWLVVGPGNALNTRTNEWHNGFCFSISDDLIHWSKPQLLMEFKQNWPLGWDEEYRIYPSLLDPQDTSRNFEITGQTPYLYFTHGHHFMSQNNGLDRDLVRVPIKFTKDILQTRWEFNDPGNDERWYPTSGLTPFTISGGVLKTSSTGTDAYMNLDPILDFNASIYYTVEIRMKVSNGFGGQFIFTTTEDEVFDEEKSVKLDLSQNKNFNVYIIDMSRVKDWKGIISKIRFHPTYLTADLEIDYIRIYSLTYK